MKSLKISLNFFGENNSDVAKLMNNLGLLYEKMENYRKQKTFI